MPVTLSSATNSDRDPEHHQHVAQALAARKPRRAGILLLQTLISIIRASTAITTPSQNGIKAEPGPSEPHHL